MTTPRDPIIAQVPGGFVFWPRPLVAMLRDEGTGRVEVVFEDGTMAHAPGPIDRFAGEPFERANDRTLVHPGLVQRRRGKLLLQLLLLELVGQERLFTYQELGFEDQRPELRRIGRRRPRVVLLAEKDSVAPLVMGVAERFDISCLVLGGQPELLETEYFVKALRAFYQDDVVVVSFVDYDYSGWIIARAFIKQLERYGVGCRSLSHMVLPSRFTSNELSQLAVPIKARSRGHQTKLRAWLDECGGIGGRGLGISSDHLRPLERACQVFAEVTGLRPVRRA